MRAYLQHRNLQPRLEYISGRENYQKHLQKYLQKYLHKYFSCIYMLMWCLLNLIVNPLSYLVGFVFWGVHVTRSERPMMTSPILRPPCAQFCQSMGPPPMCAYNLCSPCSLSPKRIFYNVGLMYHRCSVIQDVHKKSDGL